jgi:LPXTG-motif cell wall-anchored protein
MQPVKVVANKNNILIITGVSTLIIGLIAGLIYIKKKK